jgi:hypothetical protein
MKSAAQAAANWAQSSGRAVQAYEQGVSGYNGDWAGATLRQQSVMQANWNAALPRWAAGVQATGTAGWKAKTQAKSANYSTGFTAGAADQAIAIGKIMASLANIVPGLPPRGTYEQNKSRATALMDALHAQKGQLGAR